MYNQIQRAINLIRKTGDRLLIADKEENVYALMHLDQYEDLIHEDSGVRGLTENELLDKINRDIAIWKSDQEFDDYSYKGDLEENDFISNIKNNIEKISDFNFREEDKKNNWKIPGEIKEGAEEIIDEDRQYLEEI
jgi:hypothetical protein